MRTSMADVDHALGIRFYSVVCSVCSENGGNPNTINVPTNEIAEQKTNGDKILCVFKKKITFPCGHELDQSYGKPIIPDRYDRYRRSDSDGWRSLGTEYGPIGKP